MELNINYVDKDKYPDLPETKKVWSPSQDILKVSSVEPDGSAKVQRIDFSNCEHGAIGSSGGGHADIVYEYACEHPNVWLKLTCAVANVDEVASGNVVVGDNFPEWIYVATGKQRRNESTTHEAAWVPGVLSDSEKKAYFGEAMVEWREQIKIWLRESIAYADLLPDVVLHFGNLLRSADWVINQEAMKSADERLDWLILEKIVLEAKKGPRSLDADGDGQFDVQFIRNLKAMAGQYPTGTEFGALWVQTWDLTAASDVTRVNDFMADVIRSYGSSDPAVPDRTYANMPSDYDPTTLYWETL